MNHLKIMLITTGISLSSKITVKMSIITAIIANTKHKISIYISPFGRYGERILLFYVQSSSSTYTQGVGARVIFAPHDVFPLSQLAIVRYLQLLQEITGQAYLNSLNSFGMS